ncbi:MAG: DUF4838 domain-containing protein, partial [Planctomycetes bacterium]|nr:DUF4838 domain-containing protein [Planctomycetota bacterium]
MKGPGRLPDALSNREVRLTRIVLVVVLVLVVGRHNARVRVRRRVRGRFSRELAMHRRLPFLMTFGFVATLALGDADAALRLVADGKSAYGVYHSPDAPESVKLAAREIQRVIKVSTGVELPIADTPREPMICLGENAEAKKAGLTADSLPDDGFRLVTKGSNLYILGKDTPADKPTWVAWISRGTLFGAYEFLESVVGARWLMPGEWGEDVPRHTTLSVPDLSVAKSPDFQIRSLVDIQDRKRGSDPNPQKTVEWLRRNKMPSTSEGRKLNLGHAWDQYLKPEDWEAHKDYLAMSADGKPRMFAKAAYVKFCTSNPALVNAFAQGVIRWLDERPQMRGASISPSDGGDFCQCSNCQALVTPDPHGKPSYTPVILRFANDVARIVGKKHPDRMLACYVYYNYMYPPDKPVAIEPNLYLVWAPLNYYGWGLQKPVYREEFPSIVKGWTALTRNFFYHNYSTWMRSFNGAPLPPGFDILKLELPTLRKHGVQAAEMVGI